MDAINSILWLVVGTMLGWFANRMVTALIARRADRPRIPLVDFLVPDKKTGQFGMPILPHSPVVFEDESFKDQYFANDSLGG